MTQQGTENVCLCCSNWITVSVYLSMILQIHPIFLNILQSQTWENVVQKAAKINKNFTWCGMYLKIAAKRYLFV